MPRAQTRHPRRWPAAGLATAGLIVLAGCDTTASTSSTGGASTNGGTVTSSDPQMEAFAACMAENGVTLPKRPGGPQGDPPPGGGVRLRGPAEGDGRPPAPEGVDADKWAAALEACRDVMPTRRDGAPPAG